MSSTTSSEKKTYESMNGPIPKGPSIDKHGLAQQCVASSDFNDLDPFRIGYVSNICPEDGSEEFFREVKEGNKARLSRGYDSDGRIGGVYSEKNPPPGKEFHAYEKGYAGIVWKENTFIKITDQEKGAY